MKTSILVVAFALHVLPCFAGTNVTVRVIADDHTDSRWQVYSHGTNVVLRIHRRDKLTSITSAASGYSVTHTDRDGDGSTDAIMVSTLGGRILEVVKRGSAGAFVQTDQEELNEMNCRAKRIDQAKPAKPKALPWKPPADWEKI